MKLLALISAITLASSISLAADPQVLLKRLSCAASNGVTIETVARRTEGILVESRLGLLTSEFSAAVVTDENEKTSVELSDKDGRVAYILDLTLDLSTQKVQTGKVGSIIQTGDGWVGPMVVASILCDVRVK